jgi:hypothetical protein
MVGKDPMAITLTVLKAELLLFRSGWIENKTTPIWLTAPFGAAITSQMNAVCGLN